MTAATTVAPARSRVDVAGAVAAQFSQAAGSFLLQVLAARLLGKEGLAVFAVLSGLVVLATAVVSGFVGDSLTVLDRSVTAVRAGLQWWLVVLSTGVALIASLGLWGSDYLTPWEALVFGLSGAAFVAEDSFRRLLMATMRFWAIVVVDLVSLIGSVGVVAVVHATSEVTLATLLEGLLVGQVAAMAVAVVLLPPSDRWWARGTTPDRGHVFRYGKWRALQVSVRPAMLAVMRVIVVAGVGRAAYGELEGARLFVAPATLAVNGASSYLFARFARTKDVATSKLLRQSDRGVVVLATASLALGVVAALLVPSLGSAMVGDDFDLDRWGVFGWAVLAAATAAATPYGVLAAVRGRQGATLLVRLTDAVCSLVGVAIAMQLDWSETSVPYVLAASAFLGGIGIRVLIVADMKAKRVSEHHMVGSA
jgi:O-antigen/teichoic acid export membrane protein